MMIAAVHTAFEPMQMLSFDELGQAVGWYASLALLSLGVCYIAAGSACKDRIGMANSMFWFMASVTRQLNDAD